MYRLMCCVPAQKLRVNYSAMSYHSLYSRFARINVVHDRVGVFCRYHYIVVINHVLLFDRLNSIRRDVAVRLRFKIECFSNQFH